MVYKEGHVYDALDADPAAIRLIEIIGLDDHGYLNLTLHNAVIQKGSYIALSYVWGPEPAVYRVRVNGHTVRVRWNLWSFLTSCEVRGKLLWIDALCIDQHDVVEKNRQVPLMGRIFSHATKVLCWLNGGSILSTHRDQNWAWIEEMQHAAFSENADLIAYDLLRLSKHAYWSRLWIVQELQLGQEIEVHWGGHIICRERLTYIMDFEALQGSGVLKSAELQDPEGISALQSLFKRCDSFLERDKHKTNLFAIVLKYCDLLGTLPQDRVYALLALATDGATFAVDYTESCTTLLVRLLHHCKTLPDWDEILEVAHSLHVESERLDFEILGSCQQSNAAGRLHARERFQRCTHCFQHQDVGGYPDLIIGIPNIIYLGLTNSYTMFGPRLLFRTDFVNYDSESHAGMAHTYSVSTVLDHRRAPQVLATGQLHLDDFNLVKQPLSQFTFAVTRNETAVAYRGTISSLLELLTSTKQNDSLWKSCRWITCSEADLKPGSQNICRSLLPSYRDILEVRVDDPSFRSISDSRVVPRVIKWKEVLSSEQNAVLVHFVSIENQHVHTWLELASVIKEYFLLRTSTTDKDF